MGAPASARRPRALLAAPVLALVLAGCAGFGTPEVPETTMDAGTHSSSQLDPAVTYTVPEGWQVGEDANGVFSLLPPGGDFEDIYNGVGATISVMQNVAADVQDCVPAPVGPETPEGIAGELSARPGLRLSAPQQASIGGLSGIVVDVELVPGHGLPCPQMTITKEWAPALTSVDPPGSWAAGPVLGGVSRYYLLTGEKHVVGIVLDALDEGTTADDLAELDAVVQTFRFG
jgi:hypothetical protein